MVGKSLDCLEMISFFLLVGPFQSEASYGFLDHLEEESHREKQAQVLMNSSTESQHTDDSYQKSPRNKVYLSECLVMQSRSLYEE
jgi:hypothetical protein